MFRSLCVATLLGVLGLASPASASLIGVLLNASYRVPTSAVAYQQASFTPTDFTVESGIETVGLVENVTSIPVDINAFSLRVSFQTSLSDPRWNSAEFNGLVLTSASALGVSGGSVASTTTMTGFDASRVQVAGNQVLLNWQGLQYADGTIIDVVFSAIAVPEPASVALLGLAFAGIALFRRHARG